MNYRLGLDIGIASVGWSILSVDEKGEPQGIIDLGVRIFDPLEHPKDGSSLTLPRRIARGSRRRLRRRAHRIERTRNLLNRTFGEDFVDNIPLTLFADAYRLRYEALDRKINEQELAVIMLNLVKRRGFKSNRKSESKDSDAGKLLLAISNNKNYREIKGYRTVGEMLACDDKYSKTIDGVKNYFVRNKQDSYINSISRDELIQEIVLIFERQKSFNNIFATDELRNTYLDIFTSQRAFDEGPGNPSKYKKSFNVGKCTFFQDELRAPKASYTFEYTNMLQKINNLKLTGKGATELTKEQKEIIKNYALSVKEVKYTQLRKKLNLSNDIHFNFLSYSKKKTIEDIEKTRFISMSNSYEIKSALKEENKNNIELLDEIALLLSMNKSDDKIRKEIDNNSILKILDNEEIEEILKLSFSKFGYLSLKALRMIQPYLEQGEKYNKACELAGFNHRGHSGEDRYKLLNSKEIYDLMNEINVPVVKRAVSQTIKVINAIVREYGSPVAVNIELARELSKNREDRNKIKKDNDERASDNTRILDRIKNEYGITSAGGQDIIKLRLYEEQGGKCAYSGMPIDENLIFDSTYLQIDHIIPYSRSFDDSYNNKVLVFSIENQHKRNMIPYEYIGGNKEKWIEFENFVLPTYKFNYKKRDMLLKKAFTIEDEKEWKERSLNDTKYISKFMFNLINDYLLFDDSINIGKKRVIAVNGKITSYLRKMWGISKIREEGDLHHAIDATVIASVTDGIIQEITNYNKTKERYFRHTNGIIDMETGEVISYDTYDKMNLRLKTAYKDFKCELQLRLKDNPSEYWQSFLDIGYDIDKIEKLKPVFVSRMPTRKIKGQLHKATIKSAKDIDNNIVIMKTDLTNLKLDKDGEIAGYYNSQDDLLLYNALKSRLIMFNGDGKLAFKDGFYKPKSDGTQGNPVKKVKIFEKVTLGIKLDKIKGFADNASMARVDIFAKGNKYYSVPVYVSDIYKGIIPNKAINAHKKYEDWTEMDNTYIFLFSLYPNDLVFIENKEKMKFVNDKTLNKLEFKKGFVYYNSFDIDSGRAILKTHDQGYKNRVGFKTLINIEKYIVDTLGNKYKVGKEKRQLCNPSI